MKLKNLTKVAQQFIAKLQSEGFNGIYFIETKIDRLSLEDFLSDGKTKRDFNKYERDYVIFYLQPDVCTDDPCINEYTKIEFNEYEFMEDFELELDIVFKNCGGNIEIKIRDKVWEYCEYQIIRKL